MNNLPDALKNMFLLDPEITFLNHGSYGACPKPVFKSYQKYQMELEMHPVDGYVDLKEAICTKFERDNQLNYKPSQIVVSTGAKQSIANLCMVLLNPGDEVLSTNLEYGSCDRMWTYDSEQKDYKYIQADITLPIENKEEFLNEFWSSANEQTKYIFISQITSSTGMILPIPDIVIEAKKRGIKTIIDGAHVPAHIPLDIKELDPDYYTGALHKWLCCPKGISFLYVKKEYQEGIQPMVKSWGWGEEYEKFKSSIQLHSPSRFINVFQWQGTTDMSAFFTVPEAIQFQNEYDWKTVRSRCFDMVIEARNRITDITKLPKICPDSWLGHMATILFPIEDTASFKKTLYNDYQIEIPVMSHKDNTAFRISVQGYNSEADIDHLINSLEELI